MSHPPIKELVPHSGPMLLLDKVVAFDAEALCAEVAIMPSSTFCDGQAVGAWIGIEYMAQAIAAHAGYAARLRGEAVRLGLLLGSRQYHCTHAAFAVHSVLHVRVRRELLGENGLGAFACTIEDAGTGEVLASATLTVYQPDNVEQFLQRSNE